MNRKIALITGAGSGIGEAAALALAGAGWSVVLAGRRLGPLEDVRGRCGSDCLPVSVDVMDSVSVDGLFARVVEQFGRIDLLFNNAGVANDPKPLEDLTSEEWHQVWETNVTGTLLCTQAAFRLMKSQKPRGGRIINNGSISAAVPRPWNLAYTASKHAITGLTKASALEGRSHEIACGQIDIGNADTALTDGFEQGSLQADLTLRPEPVFHLKHVADAILYMAQLPLDANVLFMTVMATAMPYVGRG